MADRPVISFRTDPNLHLKLEQLRATFPNQQWGESMTWLFEQPCVIELIKERVNGD